MMKKEVFFFLVFLILVSLVRAQEIEDLGIVTNPFPTFTVSFDEPATIKDTELINSSYNTILLEKIYEAPDSKLFKYKPSNFLNNGNYRITVSAEDIYGVEQETIYKFTMDIQPVNIELVYPPLAVSPTRIFNLTIVTDKNRNATCRYAEINQAPYWLMDKNLTVVEDGVFIVPDYTFTKEVMALYVACNDSYGYINNPKLFLLQIDTTPPVFKKTIVNPVKVVELINGEIQTKIFVETDDKTVCKYSRTNSDFDEMNYFTDEDEEEATTYGEQHTLTLTSSKDGLVNAQSYSYNVSCKNKAGLISITQLPSFSVDLTTFLTISVVSPKHGGATPETNITLEIKTNKHSDCWWSNLSSIIEDVNYKNLANKFNQSNAINFFKKLELSTGTHSLYIRCSHEQEESKTSTTFTIDLTPPETMIVNDSSDIKANPESSYYTNKIRAKWHAVDNESDIAKYEYKVTSDYPEYKTIVNWTTSTKDDEWSWIDENEKGKKLNLTDGETYYVYAKAQNRAGLWSDEVSSNGVTINTALRPLVAPSCSDGVKNGNETDVDCGGSCPKCEAEASCNVDKDCRSNLCEYGTCSSLDICNNGVKDGDETDTDCGGSCNPCDINQSCEINADCTSNLCSSDFLCAEHICNDSIKGPDEADIDCGGVCEKKCSVGMNCTYNEDCESLYCEENICEEASCFDEIKNGDETGIDCGGTCEQKCLVGIACNTDNDCESDYCLDDYCEDAEKKDTDEDGIPDYWEIKYGLDPNLDDSYEDADSDGLTNLDEYGYKTDPTNKDTDSDGWKDGKEIEAGTDPLDSKSHPTSFVVFILMIIGGIALIGGLGYGVYYIYQTQMARKVAVPKPKLTPKIKKLAPKPTPKTIPVAPVITAEEKRRIKAHERFLKRMEERAKKRREILKPFGVKIEKPAIKKPAAVKKPILEKKEWLTLKEIKKPEIKKTKPKTIFEELEKIKPEKKPIVETKKIIKEKEDIFKHLGEISKIKKEKPVKDVFANLEKLKKGKVSKDVLDEITKLSKLKKSTNADISNTLKILTKGTEKKAENVEAVLSHLLKTKTVTKKGAAEILSGLREKGVLSKKDVRGMLSGIIKK